VTIVCQTALDLQAINIFGQFKHNVLITSFVGQDSKTLRNSEKDMGFEKL